MVPSPAYKRNCDITAVTTIVEAAIHVKCHLSVQRLGLNPWIRLTYKSALQRVIIHYTCHQPKNYDVTLLQSLS